MFVSEIQAMFWDVQLVNYVAKYVVNKFLIG